MDQAVIRISDILPQQSVTVRGTVESVLIQPKSATPFFEATLRDNSGRIILRWDGQHNIEGIQVGTLLKVVGTVCKNKSTLSVLHNPKYTITW